MGLSVRTSGGRFYVEKDGWTVSGPHSTKFLAEAALERLEREARCKTRPCITCRKPFRSEGPHNRMCDLCRLRARQQIIECEVDIDD